jgi:hypothetical protein
VDEGVDDVLEHDTVGDAAAVAAQRMGWAIAVDGKTLRGSRTRHSPARHVLAAADQQTGVVLAGTDVDTKTNERRCCIAGSVDALSRCGVRSQMAWASSVNAAATRRAEAMSMAIS